MESVEQKKTSSMTIFRWVMMFPAGLLGVGLFWILIQYPLTRFVMPELVGYGWEDSWVYLLTHVLCEIGMVYSYYFIGARVAPGKKKGLEILSLILLFYFFRNLIRTATFFLDETLMVAVTYALMTLVQLLYAGFVLYHVSNTDESKLNRVAKFFRLSLPKEEQALGIVN
ncbi:MAG: hypothetical protein Q4A61_03505 [Porphyromonadaceae bacterium]|nr:hypothetical protein [Porphyromonadaceae bacterium]